MKNASKKLFTIAVAGIMLFTLVTIFKPCEDPPCVFVPQSVQSVCV